MPVTVLLAQQDVQVSSSVVSALVGWAGDWAGVKVWAEAGRPGHVCAHTCVRHNV